MRGADCAKFSAALRTYLDKQVESGTITPAERKAIGEMFDEEDREKCFDAGVRMRMGLLAPAERKERPRPLLGRWKGLHNRIREAGCCKTSI